MRLEEIRMNFEMTLPFVLYISNENCLIRKKIKDKQLFAHRTRMDPYITEMHQGGTEGERREGEERKGWEKGEKGGRREKRGWEKGEKRGGRKEEGEKSGREKGENGEGEEREGPGRREKETPVPPLTFL